ncbi:hypothetical protein MMC25_006552 [Agyrium rufum]|nr:hypothetical protein [Agyrium rufum]
MSSGFVSGGTIDAPISRDEEWAKAQSDLEAARREKSEQAAQQNGKSLFEVLQANKAAKQEAFEESIRLKNQFRSLDEDEVDFLDSVLESTRAKEEALKKETTERLDEFRRLREEAEKKAALLDDADGGEDGAGAEGAMAGKAGSPNAQDDEPKWAVGGRKRKRVKEKEGVLKGVKVRRESTLGEGPASGISRRSSTSQKTADPKHASDPVSTSRRIAKQDPRESNPLQNLQDEDTPPAAFTGSDSAFAKIAAPKKAPAQVKPGLGLGDYGSDSDD